MAVGDSDAGLPSRRVRCPGQRRVLRRRLRVWRFGLSQLSEIKYQAPNLSLMFIRLTKRERDKSRKSIKLYKTSPPGRTDASKARSTVSTGGGACAVAGSAERPGCIRDRTGAEEDHEAPGRPRGRPRGRPGGPAPSSNSARLSGSSNCWWSREMSEHHLRLEVEKEGGAPAWTGCSRQADVLRSGAGSRTFHSG